jgi:D-3-phosphoglycerate dehydrogenase
MTEQKKVLVKEKLAPEGVKYLEDLGFQVDIGTEWDADELLKRIPEYHGLIIRSATKVTADVIQAGENLQVVGRAGVGVDNVDLEAATRAGIVVVNAPTGNTIAAAELTLALLFGLARKTAAADASMRRGEWKRSQFTGMEVRGKTLGIVGLGKIGQAIAARARAMQMTVLGSDPFVTHEQAANLGVELVTFDDLVARSDAITVHVPKNKSTTGLINAPVIARMKDGVLLLNVARGGVIDEQALADALRSGKVGGAGIDVFTAEPPTGNPLLDAPNTLLTPHLGASTAEAQVAVAEEVAEQILEVLDGRSARYAVNAPLLTPETAQAIAPYLPLAETLGRFIAQLARSGPRTLTLEIAGEPAAYDASSLVAAVLRGLLERDTEERVNLVNAGTLAKARGITVVERKTPDAGNFASLITLTAETDDQVVVLGGTVAHGESRLVRLQEHSMNIAPSDIMLISHHRDRPGTVGRVGALLGEADVNISSMTLARSAPRADAYMVLALDNDVPDSVLHAIEAGEAAIDTWVVRLGTTR